MRQKTKTLIAMGTCAITAYPSGQRNRFSPELKAEIASDLSQYKFLDKAMSVKEAVKTDDEIIGCPVNEQKFIEIFEKHINK